MVSLVCLHALVAYTGRPYDHKDFTQTTYELNAQRETCLISLNVCTRDFICDTYPHIKSLTTFNAQLQAKIAESDVLVLAIADW